ncbi:hypothetical protein MJO28_008255 [Puccinia striiformis f. sp. tritici]|uniref:Ketopantoate reductase C-terminal domain-containing protein n=2 Tax=Puccinia striiformis f. sp. tritici TaxID=168172 RepID=A0A0L0V0K7_9BASI|nr:hypothetical protein Pst134EA_015676 [Puccinia striiformis f. sp. tritici]KAI9602606.1 hypothetical protein H4Q26_001897 [Puccinia striiformis f. sp. tritici PST-130]KNE92721.1 hypothetical protein PSTG_13852 [Puccinia striiformis f. sp. tritici PST-78]KAH9452832.1 hypothetical protein Pst134EB_016783 [Puccinia striiformis f. sp. tritici]KAH9463589.1 hypothetical protein Pst134EA_015676 [Puccinia striiformis f. sp. tritici]KAI7949434.1 hypothetical protein MJO28_008255 [Puccinia striiformis
MSSEPIEVLLVGLGAVGGIYAYVLERSKRCRVTAITRSLYDSMQTHGLTINSAKYGNTKNWRPYRLVRSAGEAADRNYRFIICSVKCLPDVEPTSSILAPFLLPSHQHKSSHPPPTVVLIQNGIGIEQSLAEAFPLCHIISCVAWIGANMISPPAVPEKTSHPQLKKPVGPIGPVIEHGAQDRLVFGLYEGEGFAQNYISQPHDSNPGPCNRYVEGLLAEDGSPLQGDARDGKLQSGREDVKLFLEIALAGGCEAEAQDYIQPARWAKNLWNGAFSTMCTLSRATVAQLIAPESLPYTLPAVRRTMLEILYVGRALGYGESHFPARLVDEAINFTIQNYQAKDASKDTETGDQQAKPDVNPPSTQSDLVEKLSSQSLNNDVFEDDDEEEDSDEAKKANVILKPAFKPSMLIDVEMNRPMELEPIIGAVLDRARSKAIDTPRLDLLYSVLKVLQEKAVSQHAAKLKTQQEEKYLHHWAMRKPSIGGSGTADSRQAWLDEVQRRARLGEDTASFKHVTTMNKPTKPPIERKVTGKPLA